MLTRFKQNVRTYPRTAKVYLGALAMSLIAAVYCSVVTHRVFVALGALALVAFFDFITYIWVMSDSRREAVLLDALESFEGRATVVVADEDSENCGDPDCDECNPKNLWNDEEGQDIAEYAVMLAVMLVIVIGTIRLIGSSAGNVFSSIGSQIGQ
jgi:Flp pilus assembly pilin Flp